MFALRDYQTKAVGELRLALRAHQRVLFVLPTGGGKTVVFSYISHSSSARGKRILITAHRREIVEQISRALREMDVRHGMILPGHTMTDNPVQVGMVQTIARRIGRVARPDLLIVDEAHHAVAGSWRALTDHFVPRGTRVLGVTATPQRLDGKGLRDAFDAMVEGPQTRDLIAAGHLSGYSYLAPPSQADLRSVRTRMGDFATDDLARIMDQAVITGDVVEHYRNYLNGRPAIAFCVTVEHAQHVAQTFQERGFRAASVDGKMDAGERRRLIAALGNGGLNVLTSCELISEGVDVPVVSGAILLRPTKSLAMYLQQIGRCLRRKPDGSSAVILDHVGNVERHGLPDAPRSWSLAGRDKREGAPPNRTCSLCYAVYPIGAPVNCASPSDCPLMDEAGGEGRVAPEQVDGHLVEYVDPLAWAGGIDIARARGAEWYALLERCEGQRERYEQIAKLRGYKRGWIDHAMGERAAGRRGGSDFQAREFRGRAA